LKTSRKEHTSELRAGVSFLKKNVSKKSKLKISPAKAGDFFLTGPEDSCASAFVVTSSAT
jgi:hypothetical protein